MQYFKLNNGSIERGIAGCFARSGSAKCFEVTVGKQS